MITPEAIRQATERMFDFCNANAITDIIDVKHGRDGATLLLRLEDFERAFSCCQVSVTTDRGIDRLEIDAHHFRAIAFRPMPMVIGPRVEVLP